MHTSLDQALGRNPRLNRVGQSLLNIASGASAAYSLRSLTGGDPNVVRVRRDSDNAERDFTASEISSGELKNWVNSQTTLPLDLRTLQADGRTGAIIDAKAAYSLRNLSSSYTGNVVEVRRNIDGSERDFTAAEVSDGTLTTWVNESFNDALPLDTSSGASAAYSLRNLSSSYSGNVVEVRRSSDDTERNFTASEVSDGTLTDWVNTDVDKLNLQTETGSLVGNVSNETSTGFDFSVNNEGSTGFKNLLPGSQVTAGTYIATFDVVLNSGSLAGVSFRSNSPGEQTTLVVGSNSLTVNPDGTSNIYFRVDGTAVASVSITNITLTQTTADGFVKTWYDQSGSSNNATQSDSSKQPTIVSNGSLQQDADGNTAVKFDGTDDYLVKADASPELFGPYTFFTHTDRDGDNGNPFSITGDADLSARYFAIDQNANDSQFNPRSNTSQTVSQTGLTGTEVRLTTVNTTSDTSYSVGTNGAAFTTGTTSYGTMPADPDGCPRIIIGKLREGATLDVQIFGGFITEIIAYAGTTNGDQSTKRRAIEENIANHYGITLSSFSRDGFVKTWYDQSSTTGTANNNHATQSDSSKQPKIVENGNLFTGGVDFDGSTTQLDITGFSPVSLTYGAFTVASIDDNTSSSLRTIFDSSDSSDGGFAVAYGNTTSKFTPFWFDGDDSTPNLFTGGNNMTSSESLYSLILKTGASTTHINGSLNETVTNTWTTAGSNTLSKSTIGYDQSNPGRQFNGKLQEIIIYDTDQTDNRTALEANIGEHYSISGIPAYDNTVNGFVETFYDQSGNDNNATQTSADAQPKIVESGTLLDGAKFDGTDDLLQATSVTEITGPALSMFIFSENTGGGATASLNKQTAGNLFMVARDGASVSQLAIRNTTNRTLEDSLSGDERLTFVATTGNAAYKIGANGGVVTEGTDTYGDDFESGDLDTIILGSRRPTSLFDFYTGLVKEVIVYNSDQSSNRTAIETNINGHYSIY